MSKGKLDARKWASNMFKLISDISSSNHGLALGDNDLDNLSLKVLGLKWSPETDTFKFFAKIDLNKRLTKRVALSLLAKLYDPLGWILPVVVHGKLFM